MFMFALTLITATCVVVHILTDEWEKLPSWALRFRINKDNIEVKGSALPTLCSLLGGGPQMEPPDRWATLVTASFAHDGRFHLVNNMLMMWAVGLPLDAAGSEEVDAVGDLKDPLQALLDQQQGQAGLGAQLGEDVVDAVDHLRGEAQRRLVDHQEARAGH